MFDHRLGTGAILTLMVRARSSYRHTRRVEPGSAPTGRNMLVDGEWQRDVEPQTTDDGGFDRVKTSFRGWIADDPDARFRPNSGRYHLYISRSCPWAHGVVLVRRLKGLSDDVTPNAVDPIREFEGWEFGPEKDGCTEDTVNGTGHLRDV